MKLHGKRVWITGASSGLGRALAIEAADRGAFVILSARRKAALEDVARECPPGTTHVVPLDLSEPETFSDAVEAAGRIDLLINSGGISQRSLALETTAAVSRDIMETNFFSCVELSRQVLPGMIKRGEGRLVVISSVVGYFGTPLRSTYSASKHALHGYFDSLRYELDNTGVGVTIICPGFIHTDISRNAVTADGAAQGTMDAATAGGMSPEEFSREAWRGILAGKSELHIGGSETKGILLKRLAPRVFDWVIKRRNVT